MAAKQVEKQQALPEAKPKPIATTYYGARRQGKWEVCRADVYEGEGGKPRVEVTSVLTHPDRIVARERLRVLLMHEVLL